MDFMKYIVFLFFEKKSHLVVDVFSSTAISGSVANLIIIKLDIFSITSGCRNVILIGCI